MNKRIVLKKTNFVGSVILLNRKKAFDLSISLLVFVSVYSSYFEKILGINSLFFLLIPVLFVFLFGATRKMEIMANWEMVIILALLFSIPILQIIIIGFNYQMLKYSIYVLIFAFLAGKVDSDSWMMLRKTSFFISIILLADIFIKMPRIISANLRLFNVRHLLMVDKPAYSLFLTLTIMFIVLDMAYKQETSKVKAMVFIGACTIVNVFILQSKSAILVFIVSLVVLLFSVKKKTRKRLIAMILFLFGIGTTVIIIWPEVIPDYIKAVMNYHGSYSVSNSLYERYNVSIVDRITILSFAFALIKQNLFLGIGFGNYSMLAETYLKGFATQTESSIVNNFVEGGVLYGIVFIIFFVYDICKYLYKPQLFRTSQTHTELFLSVIMLLLFNILNDYINVYFWVYMAFATRYIFNTKRFINCEIDNMSIQRELQAVEKKS